MSHRQAPPGRPVDGEDLHELGSRLPPAPVQCAVLWPADAGRETIPVAVAVNGTRWSAPDSPFDDHHQNGNVREGDAAGSRESLKPRTISHP